MSLTKGQWALLGVTLAVAGATIWGGVLSLSPTAPKPAPGASQPAPLAVQAQAQQHIPTALDTAMVAVDTVVQWVGCIAADSTTGALRSDLGWRSCGKGSPELHLVYCRVGTIVKPVFRRVLIAPRGNILWLTSNPASYTIADCTQAFQKWDSLETASQGRWPRP
jgi:hypothetical protein